MRQPVRCAVVCDCPVAIMTVALPLAAAGTLVLAEGLNEHVAYGGNGAAVLHERLSTASLVWFTSENVSGKLAVCPLVTVWLGEPVAATAKSNPTP